jgi:serine protease Do
MRTLRFLLSCCVLALVVILAGGTRTPEPPQTPAASPVGSGAAAPDPRRTPVVLAVERATPSVVTITVEVQTASPFLLFGGGGRSGASQGSGVIIAPDGVVLTNAHVVDGARRISVFLQDGRSFEADVVAQDTSIDLAVLRLNGASGLPTIAIGDSGGLLLGEPAIAIGNPYGLGLTVSTGVIASIGRDVSSGEGPTQTYIQTDAAINPGNSGGALVNIHGELIGINTFIHSAAEGIGFAIPVSRARKVADDLLNFGSVQVPWLGCDLVNIDRRALSGELAKGAVLVQRVDAGGPAEKAGLRAGDLLYEVDGHHTATRGDVNARLSERSPGQTVRVSVVRGDATKALEVVTQRAPADLGTRSLEEVLGVGVAAVRGGLEVSRAAAGGSWTGAGLRAGDVILAVEGMRLRDPEQLATVLGEARARHRGSVWFTVYRAPYQGSVEVRI